MIQQETAAPQTPQAAPEAAPQPQATQPEATPQAVPQETQPASLQDFTFGLLGDPAALSAFQLDPQGALSACGLNDITPGDVDELLPLVLDSISSISGVSGFGAPSAITALVTDFGNLGDVSNTLDASVLTGTEVVSDVSDLAYDNALVGKATDVADVADTADVLVKDLDTNALVKDVLDSDVLVKDVLVKDVSDLDVTVKDVADVTGNVVQDVAQVGDIHNDLGHVLGDIEIGDIDVLDGGAGNGNLLDLHL